MHSGGSQKLEFRYDYLGRRIEKKVFTTAGTTTTLTQHVKYVYDGWNLIAEVNGAAPDTVLRTFTWGLDASETLGGAGGVGGLLRMEEGGVGYHAVYDPSHNVTGLVRESAGQATLVASYAYGPFGEKLAADTALGGFIDRNPFRYSTKYTDAETGLVYYGHRYYEPRTGRFLGRDPLGEAGGSNLYGFVRNNPVKTWDYLGMVTPERAREILAMDIHQGMHLFLGVGDSITHNHPGRSLEEVSDHDGFDLVMTRTQLEAIASRTDDGNYYPDGSPVKFGDFGEVTVVAPNNTGILRQPGYATSTITGRTHMVGTSPSFPGDPVFAGQVKDAALGFVIGDIMDGITILNPNSSGRDRMIAVGSIILGLGPLPNVGPGLRAGRAAEFPGGVLTETQLINQAESYLGAGYREVSPGRFKSADGTRQFRYGSHETRNPNNHHAHFESLTGEDVTENTVVQIILDPGP